MSDLPNHVGDRRLSTVTPSIEPFGTRARDDYEKFAAAEGLDPGWLRMLCEACGDPDDTAVRRLLVRMQDAGLAAEEIAEGYVPAAARILGDRWCEDTESFARVTIGCSRLHGLLRDLGPYWRVDGTGNAYAPAVLVMVAEDIYHTLGATVLAGKLRRNGFNVKLWLGVRPDAVADVLSRCDYEAVLVSSSSGESLEAVRRIVKSVKSAMVAPPVVILGGTVIDEARETKQDLLALTGADHATNDPAKAIELCVQAARKGKAPTLTPTDQHRQG